MLKQKTGETFTKTTKVIFSIDENRVENEIPNALPELIVSPKDLKIGQKIVMLWSPTISRKQNEDYKVLAPITSVKVGAKTTRVEVEQGSLKVKGIWRYDNDEKVRIVE